MWNRLLDAVETSFASVGAALLIYLALSIDFEVVSRYFFGRPIRGVVDFTEYGLLYILFLSTAWVLAKEGHVKIDILLEALPSRVQRALNTITSLIAALACAVFFYFSLWLTWEAFEGADILWRAIIVPRWSIFVIMPLGSVLLTIQFLRRAWLYWSRHEKGGS